MTTPSTDSARPAALPEGLQHRHLTIAEADLQPADAPDGAGDIAKLPVWSDGSASTGIWQMTPGRLEAVPGPETVVILAGRASVHLEPSGEDVELAAGDALTVCAGERADWTVHETVRKFYIVGLGA